MLLWWFVATDLAYLFALGENEITIFATLDELTENDLSNSIFLDQFVFIVIAVDIDVSRICLCQFLKLLRSVLGMFFQLKLRGRLHSS